MILGSIAGRISNGDQPQPNVFTVIVPQSRDLRLIPRYREWSRATIMSSLYEETMVTNGFP